MLELRAGEVSLAGNFNGRNVNSLLMKKDKKGILKFKDSLSPGKL